MLDTNESLAIRSYPTNKSVKHALTTTIEFRFDADAMNFERDFPLARIC